MKFHLKKVKYIIILFSIILISIVFYLFCHSSPKRLIRTDLFIKGHIIGAFTTNIYELQYDSQYGELYSCKNPAIGPDHYAFKKKNGLWYINLDGTGGGWFKNIKLVDLVFDSSPHL